MLKLPGINKLYLHAAAVTGSVSVERFPFITTHPAGFCREGCGHVDKQVC